MAKTVNAGFATLVARLVPSVAEINASSGHSASVEAKLKSALAVQNFFGAGSAINGTGIRYYSDIDYFAMIPSQNQRDNSAHMLTIVKRVLQDQFPYVSIGVRTPAVVCEFGDSAADTLEVVPAYYYGRDETDKYNIYEIPQADGDWIKSSPKVHCNYVTRINNDVSSKVRSLIRLLKAVKYYNSIPISSFYLELRIAEWASSEETIVYSFDVRTMLKQLVNCDLAQMSDPMGVSGYVPAATTENCRLDALSKLTTALDRANHARAAEGRGAIQEAFDYWDKVFNGGFPAYG